MVDNYDPQLSKPINDDDDDDIPSQEDINETPYYDNASAPTIQNPTENKKHEIQNPSTNPSPDNPHINIQPQYPNQNNIQSQIYSTNNNSPPNYNPNNNPPTYYNPNNNQPQYYPPPSNPQQDNQAFPGEGPYYPPPIYNNKNLNYNNGIIFSSQQQVVPEKPSFFENPKIVICLSIFIIFVVIADVIFQIINELSPFMLIDDAALLIIAIIHLILICKGKSFRNLVFGCIIVIVFFGGFVLRVVGMIKLRASGSSFAFFFILIAIRSFAIFPFILTTCCGS